MPRRIRTRKRGDEFSGPGRRHQTALGHGVNDRRASGRSSESLSPTDRTLHLCRGAVNQVGTNPCRVVCIRRLPVVWKVVRSHCAIILFSWKILVESARASPQHPLVGPSQPTGGKGGSGSRPESNVAAMSQPRMNKNRLAHVDNAVNTVRLNCPPRSASHELK
jgi:hypothetical protein